jgi:uncharacterized membrane protein
MNQPHQEPRKDDQSIDLRDRPTPDSTPEEGAVSHVIQQQTYLHQGPLPPPDSFAGYERVLPGAAERIMALAEREHHARIENINLSVRSQVHVVRMGQWLAFLLAMVSVVAAIVFFAVSKPLAGAAFLGMPAVLLIRSFLPSRSTPKDG